MVLLESASWRPRGKYWREILTAPCTTPTCTVQYSTVQYSTVQCALHHPHLPLLPHHEVVPVLHQLPRPVLQLHHAHLAVEFINSDIDTIKAVTTALEH